MDYSFASSQTNPTITLLIGILYVVLIAFYVVCAWKIYEKAHRPGWASIIPFYNIYVLLQIVEKPTWWIILHLIPVINIVIALIVAANLARVFGKSSLFGVLFLGLLSFIGYPMLAFGSYTYKGTNPTTPTPTTPAVTPQVAPSPNPQPEAK